MLREILARFGIRVNTAPLTAANTAISGAIGGLGVMGALLAGGLIVRGLRNFVTEMIDLGDELGKTSRQLGISADALAAWRFAAERSGVPAAQLTNGLRRLQRNIVDAGDGMASAQLAFEGIRTEFRNANTGELRELDDILLDVADGFVGLATQTERSGRAQQLFGRAGAQLLPFFENGSAGIQEMLDRFEELTGGGFGDFVQQGEDAQDALADFDLVMTSIKTTIAVELLPVFTRFTLKVVEWVRVVREATENTDLWKLALITLGAVAAAVGIAMFIAFIKPLIIIALIAAAILIAVLAIDDLITFIKGGDSALGRMLDRFSPGLADRVRSALIGGFKTFISFLQNQVFPTLDGLRNALIGGFKTFISFLQNQVFPTLDGLRNALIGGFKTFVAFVQNQVFPVLARLNRHFEIDMPAAISGLAGLLNPLQLAAKLVLGIVSQITSAFVSPLRPAAALIDTLTRGATNISGILNTITSAVGAFSGLGGTGASGESPSVRRRGGTDMTQNQQVTVNVDNRGSAEGVGVIRRAVIDAVNEVNSLAARAAQRVLTQVVD